MHSSHITHRHKRQFVNRIVTSALISALILCSVTASSFMVVAVPAEPIVTPSQSKEASQNQTKSPAKARITPVASIYTEQEAIPVPPVREASEKPAWWTDEDAALLAAVISAESRGESYEGQLAVGCVILNRLECGAWGDTLGDVIYAKNQFAKPFWQYGKSEEQAAIACLEGFRIFPAGVIFFQEKKVGLWYGAKWYTSIGGHNFYEQEALSESANTFPADVRE